MPVKKGDTKQQIKNLFISGLDDNTDIEIKRKAILLNVISIIGILNLVPLGISAIIREKLTLGTFDLIVASVLIVLLVLLRKQVITFLSASLALLWLKPYSSIFLQLEESIILDTFGLILFHYSPHFLLGSKKGAIATLILLPLPS